MKAVVQDDLSSSLDAEAADDAVWDDSRAAVITSIVTVVVVVAAESCVGCAAIAAVFLPS